MDMLISHELNSIQIKEYVKTDKAALSALYLSCRVTAYTWMDTSIFSVADFESDTLGEEIWVAWVDSEPVGFISASIAESYLHLLFVHEAYQGRGIGKMLLNRTIESTNKPVVLKCLKENWPMLAFFEYHGFRVVSETTSRKGPAWVCTNSADK